MAKQIAKFLFLCLLNFYVHAQTQECTEKTVDFYPGLHIRRKLFENHFEFTIKMFEALQMHTPTGNIFFSPYSMYQSLLLVYFGAEGVSERELINLLDLHWARNKDEVYLAYHSEKRLREIRDRKSLLDFVTVETLFVDKRIELDICIETLHYGEIESIDFHDAYGQSIAAINRWVNLSTRNEIDELLAVNETNNEMNLVLANAVAFKMLWENEFDPRNTRTEIFYSSPLKRSLVAMMQKKGTFDFSVDEDLQAHVIIVPYANLPEDLKSYEIVMIFLLPPFTPDSLDRTLSRLTAKRLDRAIEQSEPVDVNIAMPKINLVTEVDLEPVLRNVGLESLFDANKVELGGFTKGQNFKFPLRAKQKMKITINEKGSAPLAPFVSFRLPNDPVEVNFNHPFLFLTYDKARKTVLVAAIIRDVTE